MIFEEKNKHNFEKFFKIHKKTNHFIALAIFLILEHHAVSPKKYLLPSLVRWCDLACLQAIYLVILLSKVDAGNLFWCKIGPQHENMQAGVPFG